MFFCGLLCVLAVFAAGGLPVPEIPQREDIQPIDTVNSEINYDSDKVGRLHIKQRRDKLCVTPFPDFNTDILGWNKVMGKVNGPKNQNVTICGIVGRKMMCIPMCKTCEGEDCSEQLACVCHYYVNHLDSTDVEELQNGMMIPYDDEFIPSYLDAQDDTDLPIEQFIPTKNNDYITDEDTWYRTDPILIHSKEQTLKMATMMSEGSRKVKREATNENITTIKEVSMKNVTGNSTDDTDGEIDWSTTEHVVIWGVSLTVFVGTAVAFLIAVVVKCCGRGGKRNWLARLRKWKIFGLMKRKNGRKGEDQDSPLGQEQSQALVQKKKGMIFENNRKKTVLGDQNPGPSNGNVNGNVDGEAAPLNPEPFDPDHLVTIINDNDEIVQYHDYSFHNCKRCNY